MTNKDAVSVVLMIFVGWLCINVFIAVPAFLVYFFLKVPDIKAAAISSSIIVCITVLSLNTLFKIVLDLRAKVDNADTEKQSLTITDNILERTILKFQGFALFISYFSQFGAQLFRISICNNQLNVSLSEGYILLLVDFLIMLFGLFLMGSSNSWLKFIKKIRRR